MDSNPSGTNGPTTGTNDLRTAARPAASPAAAATKDTAIKRIYPYEDPKITRDDLRDIQDDLRKEAADLVRSISIADRDAFLKRFEKGGELYKLIEINESVMVAAEKGAFVGIDTFPRFDKDRKNSDVIKTLNRDLDLAFTAMVKLIKNQDQLLEQAAVPVVSEPVKPGTAPAAAGQAAGADKSSSAKGVAKKGAEILSKEETDALMALGERSLLLQNLYTMMGNSKFSAGFNSRYIMDYDNSVATGLKASKDLFVLASKFAPLREASVLEAVSRAPRASWIASSVQKWALAVASIGAFGSAVSTHAMLADRAQKVEWQDMAAKTSIAGNAGVAAEAAQKAKEHEDSETTERYANYVFGLAVLAGIGMAGRKTVSDSFNAGTQYREMIARMKDNKYPNTTAGNVPSR